MTAVVSHFLDDIGNFTCGYWHLKTTILYRQSVFG